MTGLSKSFTKRKQGCVSKPTQPSYDFYNIIFKLIPTLRYVHHPASVHYGYTVIIHEWKDFSFNVII